MREVRFFADDEEFCPRVITLFTRYHRAKATYKLTAKSIELPISQKGEYYVFEDERFCVCEGEGAMYFRDYPKFLDFSSLDISALDRFLVLGAYPLHTHISQKRLIGEFLRVYDMNLAKNALYLLPNGYERIEELLGEQECAQMI